MQEYDESAEGETPTWRQHGQSVRDEGFIAEHENHGQAFRLAIFYFVMLMLGVGSAFAWHAAGLQSTIGTWTGVATSSFVRTSAAAPTTPPAIKHQSSTAALAQRITVLSNEVGLLKQQVQQLNAAQLQSARSAAAQQLKLSALQQLLEQKDQAPSPKSPQLDIAAKQKRVPLPKPRPRFKPTSQAGMPLHLGPSWTAQR
jgi:hypothetical protein